MSAEGLATRPGSDADAIDGVAPRMVVSPRRADEVAALVRTAREQRLAMAVVGGATSLGAGDPLHGLDVLMSMRAMDAVIERSPDDMTITVEAGITLAHAAAALAGDRQRIALDSRAPERATLGGLAAANATGGLAYGFGTPRDLVLGMTVVDGRARTLRFGGRVVKNVAGYDLVRLFTGSFGTLGVICQLTLRTHPLPDAAATLVSRFARAAELDRARAAIFHSELPLAAFDLHTVSQSRERDLRLVLRIEGTAPEVDYQRRRLQELCGDAIIAQSTDWTSPFLVDQPSKVVVRMAALPDRVVAMTQELCDATATSLRIGARLGDGTLRLCANGDREDDLAALITAAHTVAAAHRATAILEHAPGALKLRFRARNAAPPGFALMERLKQTFDPDGVFAPRRFVGTL